VTGGGGTSKRKAFRTRREKRIGINRLTSSKVRRSPPPRVEKYFIGVTWTTSTQRPQNLTEYVIRVAEFITVEPRPSSRTRFTLQQHCQGLLSGFDDAILLCRQTLLTERGLLLVPYEGPVCDTCFSSVAPRRQSYRTGRVPPFTQHDVFREPCSKELLPVRGTVMLESRPESPIPSQSSFISQPSGISKIS